MIKNIQLFRSAADIFAEFRPAVLENLSEDENTAVFHIDDFEAIEYFVINESKVIAADSISGDVIQEFNTIDEFTAATLAYIREEN